MSLSDKEILELNELCNALIDGAITQKQGARLAQWLRGSVEAREYYVRAMGLSASLISYASELQTEAPEAPVAPSNIIPLFRWVLGSLAAAAAIALVAWLGWPRSAPALASRPNEFVAQLTGLKSCQWADGAASVPAGERLLRGQRLELARGFAEITFDSGAQVLLEGPASFELKSAWEAGLARGTLKASVPPQALGFRVSNPAVEVVDLGTEFTMSADASGVAEVLVLKGQVEVQPSTAPDRQPIVLRERESRRFAASGISPSPDSGERFARLAQPIPLDHFTPPTDCLHWSFDETSGESFKAEAAGVPAAPATAQLKNLSDAGPAAAHVAGKRLGGLHFDGHLYVNARFPGIAQYAPHTVVFWVKVPKDASLGNAYAMVAWGGDNQRLGSHPIHIAWNRNPNEAALGVLRTDYGGGFAVGATPLRDGRWHHIAVVLLPRNDPQNPLEVNQYVDGRLEGEGKPSPPGSEIFTRAAQNASKDSFWLGCRLGINGVRSERFCGEMDELFIADRALEPQEIVRLMYTNELQLKLAAAALPERAGVQQ
jgi:hypothetical protein